MEGNQTVKTIIGQDVEIVGSVKCAGSIQLDGKLNGDMTCSGAAIIGAGANVKGNLSVESVTILGQVNGNVTAKDKIELKASANLNGDLRAKRLSVEDGVTFIGKSEVNPSGGASRPDSRPSPDVPKVPETPKAAGDEEDKGRGNLFTKK